METAEEYQGRRQRWHSGYRNKKTAHKALSDLVAAANRGDYVEPSKQTFGEYLVEWLTAITPTVQPSTLYSHRRNLVLHVKPNIGNVPLLSLDEGQLNSLYGRLPVDGRRDRPGGLSPRTVRYLHTILHRAFKDAVRWGRLARNPADAADPPQVGRALGIKVQAWSAETLGEFLSRSSTDDDRYFTAMGHVGDDRDPTRRAARVALG